MRLVSEVVATAVIVLIVAAAALLLYLWAGGAVGGSTASGAAAAEHLRSGLRLDLVSPLVRHGFCVYFTTAVHNVGATTLLLEGNRSGYLLGPSGGTRLAAAPSADYTLPPGGSAYFRLVPLAAIRRPTLLKVVASNGVTASAPLSGVCSETVIGRVFRMPPVDGAYASYELLGGVIVEVNVSIYNPTLRTYNVSYRVSWPSGIGFIYGWAEILTVNGSHPRWVGKYSIVETYYQPPVGGPNYWANYWVPVAEDEFPVTVVIGAVYRRS